MNAKSGKACTLVEPAAPKAPEEADSADPGEVEQAKARQIERGTGKYGSQPVSPFVAPKPDEAKEKETELSWIEVLLVGEDGKPVPGERYRITVPDGRVAEGTLGADGVARVEGFESGQCTITFPDLDKAAWEDA